MLTATAITASPAAIGAATTALGLVATLWGLLAARGAFAGAGGAALVATLLLLLVATWPLVSSRLAGAWKLRRSGVGAAPRLDRPLPAGIDGAAFLADARGRFMRLQAAWDARDLQALRHLTMPDVFEDLRHTLLAIESPAAASRTDVLTLDATLLALEELGGAWLASVEFSGLMRESAGADAVPFRELWMLAADKGDAGGEPAWRLARQQALF